MTDSAGITLFRNAACYRIIAREGTDAGGQTVYTQKAALHTYRVFISHAWRYSDGYSRAVKMLNDTSRFKWANYSVPEHDPVDSTAGLREELRQQIRPVEVVLVVAGMYVNHSGWISFEMNYADEIGKPMVGIRPWGAQRTPKEVQDRVGEMVGWNSASIVSAIRRHAKR